MELSIKIKNIYGMDARIKHINFEIAELNEVQS